MKLFKEICAFAVICYISCIITKIALNGFSFEFDYLIDSLVITSGSTFGWFIFEYIRSKKNRNDKTQK